MPRFILTRFGAIPVDVSDRPKPVDVELPNWLAYTILAVAIPLVIWGVHSFYQYIEKTGAV